MYNECMKNYEKYNIWNLEYYKEGTMLLVIEKDDEGRHEVVAHIMPLVGESSSEAYDRWLEEDIEEEGNTKIFTVIK